MVRPLSEMIKDADNIIFGRQSSQEKTAGKKTTDIGDDDVFKLAEQIRKPVEVPTEKKANEEGEFQFDLREKVAHAIALVDTLVNMPTLMKVAEFEANAKAAGFTDAQIAEQLEKTASVKFVSVLSQMPWLLPES